jgi:hypothetical protein
LRTVVLFISKQLRIFVTRNLAIRGLRGDLHVTVEERTCVAWTCYLSENLLRCEKKTAVARKYFSHAAFRACLIVGSRVAEKLATAREPATWHICFGFCRSF